MEAHARIQQFLSDIAVLLREIPRIQAMLPEPRPELSGIEAVRQRWEAHQRQQGQPVLVATMYGPTGAGKSTLFRLLTGIVVPAGDGKRPLSLASAAAVPPAAADAAHLAAIFPGFRVERLQRPEQLQDPGVHPETLFYQESVRLAGEDSIGLILVDVPDFNSVTRTNWAKAERMLERAEIVLYIVNGESYADYRAVQELQRCCQLATRLAYLFTKTAAEPARQKWQDLLEKTQAVNPDWDFRQRRHQGDTLHAFLSQAWVYHSPFQEQPTLESVQPIYPIHPPLHDVLRGMHAGELVLESLQEAATNFLRGAPAVIRAAHDYREALQTNLARAERLFDGAAEQVVGDDFPIGRVLELLIEQSRERQGTWLRMLTLPMRFVSGQVYAAVNYTRDFIRQFQAAPADTAARPDAERQRLHAVAEQRVDACRDQFEAERSTVLSREQTRRALAICQDTPLPTPGSEWEAYVREALDEWSQAHPTLSSAIPSVLDVAGLAGAGVLVGDLMISGGFIASIGAAGAGGLLGVFGAMAADWFQRFHLEEVAKEADRRWREQRIREIDLHLRAHLFGPLFAPWRDQVKAIDHLPLDACTQTLQAWHRQHE